MGSKREKIKNFFSLLLSHHTEEYYNRTFTLSIRGKEVHFCARCSGVILSFIVALFVIYFMEIELEATFSLILATILVIPVVFDWGTQKLGYRESINSIRFITGSLLGIGISLLQFTYSIHWITFIVIAVYLVIFFIISMRSY
ncbi:MAG: DUF2085 domain-containing protein [Candidatus Helarchaeota archaeon]